MEITDYVSYDLALKLKACGFDEPCDHYYTPEIWHEGYIEYPMLLWEQTAINSNDIIYFDERVSAPTLWQAHKWLREKWGIHVDACAFSDYSTDADGNVCDRWNFWGIDLFAVVGGEKMIEDDGEYDSYEQALSAGIAAALELIKKEE